MLWNTITHLLDQCKQCKDFVLNLIYPKDQNDKEINKRLANE